MTVGRAMRVGRCGLLLLVALVAAAADARAQGAVGSGPLTTTLGETEPTVGVLGMGPIKLAPGIVVSEVGTDSNVFDEAQDPKDDFVAIATPDVSAFSRTRFLQVSAYYGMDLNYYHTYTSERSVGYDGRVRVDLLLSRLFPFAGYGQTQTRERPNGEVDVRADHRLTEVSGGLGFRLSDTSSMYASMARMTTHYTDAVQSSVELGQTLSRYNDDFNGGFRTALTPLTTFTLRAGYRRDVFYFEPARNSDSRYADASFTFLPQATINGVATIGYLDFKAVDPLVKAYHGMTATVAVTYPFLEIGRFNFIALRSLEYSFDSTEAYYVSTSYALTYTHRLFGDVDAQVQGSRAFFDYGNRQGAPARRDTLDTVLGGLGYNLRNKTRVALNYDYTRRRSPELAERNYDRRRVYLSWMYAF